jgi:hypothetical protein
VLKLLHQPFISNPQTSVFSCRIARINAGENNSDILKLTTAEELVETVEDHRMIWNKALSHWYTGAKFQTIPFVSWIYPTAPDFFWLSRVQRGNLWLAAPSFFEIRHAQRTYHYQCSNGPNTEPLSASNGSLVFLWWDWTPVLPGVTLPQCVNQREYNSFVNFPNHGRHYRSFPPVKASLSRGSCSTIPHTK